MDSIAERLALSRTRPIKQHKVVIISTPTRKDNYLERMLQDRPASVRWYVLLGGCNSEEHY